MAELPDDFMQEMQQYEHQKAMRDFGNAAQRKKPLAIPKQVCDDAHIADVTTCVWQLQPPRPAASFSYEKELAQTRTQLVASH